jgi:hypothetical protein
MTPNRLEIKKKERSLIRHLISLPDNNGDKIIQIEPTWIFFDLDEISESADFKFWVSCNIQK